MKWLVLAILGFVYIDVYFPTTFDNARVIVRQYAPTPASIARSVDTLLATMRDHDGQTPDRFRSTQ